MLSIAYALTVRTFLLLVKPKAIGLWFYVQKGSREQKLAGAIVKLEAKS